MALTLDATVGGTTANSYADEAAAVAAASYRIGPNAAAFAGLTSDQRIQALVSATNDIDSLGDTRVDGYVISFLGERATDTQALEWPRTGVDGVADDALPSNLVKACIELAIAYAPAFVAGAGLDPMNGDPTAARIKRTRLDVIEKEFFAPGPTGTALERFPGMVQRWLASLLEFTLIGGQWGTGTVIRSS